MINAINEFEKALKNYNSITGEGANELLKALVKCYVKSKEVDEALERVQNIYGGNK